MAVKAQTFEGAEYNLLLLEHPLHPPKKSPKLWHGSFRKIYSKRTVARPSNRGSPANSSGIFASSFFGYSAGTMSASISPTFFTMAS